MIERVGYPFWPCGMKEGLLTYSPDSTDQPGEALPLLPDQYPRYYPFSRSIWISLERTQTNSSGYGFAGSVTYRNNVLLGKLAPIKQPVINAKAVIVTEAD